MTPIFLSDCCCRGAAATAAVKKFFHLRVILYCYIVYVIHKDISGFMPGNIGGTHENL
jgi:hypothetical protein